VARQERWRETAISAWRKVRGGFNDESSAPVIVLEVDVPMGVVGYVASRLTEETGRPVIMVTERGSESVAEARGPVGFNFVDAFSAMSDLFIGYGGHPRAAGFSMDPSHLSAFKDEMTEFAGSHPPVPLPRQLDAELPFVEASPELGLELEKMWPFGQSNRRALFVSRGVTSSTVDDAGARGVRFGTPVRIGERPVDVVFRLRNSEGVALISIVDAIPAGASGG